MPAAAIIPAVATVGAAIIGSNAAKHAGDQAAQQQQNLANNSFQQQTQYIDSKEQALRSAILGIMGQGNPYLSARSQIAPPQFLPGGNFGGGSFGGQQYGGGSATPQQQTPPQAGLPPNLGAILGQIFQGIGGRGTPGPVPGNGGLAPLPHPGQPPVSPMQPTTPGGPFRVPPRFHGPIFAERPLA